MFEFDDPTQTTHAAGFYAYSTLSNMGDCIPAKTTYASSTSGEMDAKDTSSRARRLSRPISRRPISPRLIPPPWRPTGSSPIGPTYALWSAGSRKLRFIRVPKGTSIQFDKVAQTFAIPPSTRFLQDLLPPGHRRRRTHELPQDGDPAHRRAARHGGRRRQDLGAERAVRDLYLERRRDDPRDCATSPIATASGFADLTTQYDTNEIEYRDLLDSLPPGAGSLASKINAALRDPINFGLVQHYAVPGSKRCVQCHQGSPTRDFVLGFYPLQGRAASRRNRRNLRPRRRRRARQLQRFIDYGLITGMASPADVVPLEDSQLPRKPRTDGELKAQAYMIGNCAHCHNPRGYPSQAKPDLATALNFLPGSDADAPGKAGVFELSLEQMSPLRQRGANQSVPIPYITPSLWDYPVADTADHRIDNGSDVTEDRPGRRSTCPMARRWGAPTRTSSCR